MKSDPLPWTRDFLGNQCPCGSRNLADTCCWKGDGCWEKTPTGKLPTKQTHFSNPSCYLSSRSSCSSKTSREHFISRNILEKLSGNKMTIENAGFFFGGKDRVEIGIDCFVARVLCDNHNSALSLLDTAAGAAFERIEMLTKDIKRVYQKRQTVNSFHVASGLDIERWLIKVFCGLVAAGKIKGASGTAIQQSSIPQEVTEALTDARVLQPPLGLHFHNYSGQLKNLDCRLAQSSSRMVRIRSAASSSLWVLWTWF